MDVGPASDLPPSDGNRMNTPNSLSASLEVLIGNGEHGLSDDTFSSWNWQGTSVFSGSSPVGSLPNFGLDDVMTGLDPAIPGLWADVDFGDIFGSAGASGLVTPAENGIPANAQQAMDVIKVWTASKKPMQERGASRQAFLDWCSAAPDPCMYDLDVLDIWASIAIERIGGTFTIFDHFYVDESTDDALYIAMAAVGGVYCDVENSFQLAKVMYNDARRLALAMPLRSGQLSIDCMLSLSKTFVLLEIYGIVSGDKRSFEFVDVFHADLLQAVRVLLDACATAPSDKERNVQTELLVESLHVLECYRTILFHRSSILPPHLTRMLGSDRDENETCGDGSASALIRSLCTPDAPINPKLMTRWDIVSLTAVSLFGSHNRRAESEAGPMVWSDAMIGLALRRWYEAKPAERRQDTLFLYHLVGMYCHADLHILQLYSRLGVKDTQYSRTHQDVRDWRLTSRCSVAVWHARNVLAMVENWPPMPGSTRRPPLDTPDTSAENPGSPHVSYCIYFAALVRLCENHKTANRGAEVILDFRTAVLALTMTKGRIAIVLKKALQEIEV